MLTRRSLFASAASLSVAAVASSLDAAEPPARHSGSRFKFSLAAYSYRDLFRASNQPDAPPPLTLFDFLDDCARFGLEGAELTQYFFPKDADAAFLRRLKAHAFRLGLDISALAIGNDFGKTDAEQHAGQIAHVKKWIELAEPLGANAIRVFAGQIPKDGDAEAAHRQIVAGLEECSEHAGRHGIYLALENHGGPTATAEGLLRIVRAVQSPWLAVNLDTGNFHGADPYAEMEAAAPYAVNVQVKVVTSSQGGPKTPTDYRRIAKILRGAGYRGYVALEYEEPGDPREESRKALDQLRAAFSE